MKFSLPAPLQRAFTLTEILVLLAIIAVVATLILSGVAKIRDRAASAQCISNLRQVGTALNLYAAENNGIYPPTSADGQNSPKGWIQSNWAVLLMNKGYASSGRIFLCPSIAPKIAAGDDLQAIYAPSRYAHQFHTYGLRSMHPAKLWPWPGGDGDFYNAPIRVSAIEQPSKSIVVSDSIGFFDGNRTGSYHFAPYISWSGLHFRHSDKANSLFADGHVESLNTQQMSEVLREEGSQEHGVTGSESSWTMLPN